MPSSPFRMSFVTVCSSSGMRGSCLRPSAWRCASTTTSKCWRPWAFAPESRTTQGIWTVESRVSLRTRSSTTSRRTSSASSTRAMSLCRKFAACMRATVLARSPWRSMASGFPVAWITGRFASMSSRTAFRSSFTCRLRRAITRNGCRRRSSSRSSDPPAFSIPRSSFARA